MAGRYKYHPGVPLKEYFDSRMTAMEKAVEVARIEMERRLEGMNEFREQLRAQSVQFVTRAEADLTHGGFANEIKVLTKAKDQMEGKASQTTVIITLVISVVGLLIALAGMLRHFRV